MSTVGLDIAKSEVHGVDAAGQVVLRRQLRRRHVLAFFQKLPPCLVGIEACTSSHHWSRELQALGHTVRLMPPAYVKPYVSIPRRVNVVVVQAFHGHALLVLASYTAHVITG
jgi:transposase